MRRLIFITGITDAITKDPPDYYLFSNGPMAATRPADGTARSASTDTAPNLLPGMDLGAWRLLARIGGGPLCDVYMATPVDRRPDSGACYAVKKLKQEWETEPAAVAMIRNEAHVGMSVSHPHLVPVLAAATDGPPYYVAMPLLSGSTLESQLSANNTCCVPVALWICRQIAEALQALHDPAGLIHGDVKPSNVFLSPDGHVTLIDLGFARPADRPTSFAQRPVVGTINYIAPEVLTSTLATDIRSDIYSLGVMLYEMLAGQLPFAGDDPSQVARMHRESIAPRLKNLVPTLPNGVVNLVRKMLAKESLRRPQSPQELIRGLVRLEVDCFAERTAERQL